MTQTVLILGPSGKVGTHSARAFTAAGWQVKPYKRGTDMAAAAQGVDVIVNGLNPPHYRNWETEIPKITKQVIAAAKASGATVILPGNVYNFGTAPAPWGADTQQNPCSVKGQIRVDMERAYLDAGIRTIILRAGNFIDPDRNACVMSVMYMAGIKGGKLTVPGGQDVPQPFAYLPDWARAVVGLAEQRDRLSTFEDVPFPGHVMTAHELAKGLSQHLGRPIGMCKFPWWAMRLARPVLPIAGELLEMRYLWDHPHHMDSEKFAALLPDFVPTPMPQVMAAALPPDIADK